MLLNNDVNMNNVMMLWGEFNVLMNKCNYQSKEQYTKKGEVRMLKFLIIEIEFLSHLKFTNGIERFKTRVCP